MDSGTNEKKDESPGIRFNLLKQDGYYMHHVL
jgi:hypothetical protein